ncbi:MAG: HNH endonuclease [Candidatus Peribacteraceae bacterium]|nr:HNH endonuclease [Candidatus Peribacteraceae bacterium]
MHKKKCRKCGKPKPLNEYYKRSKKVAERARTEGGRYQHDCKECTKRRVYENPNRYWHLLAGSLRQRGAEDMNWETLKAHLGKRKTCHISGMRLTKKTAVVDHVVPISRGGTHEYSNLKWAHHKMNRLKGSFLLKEFYPLIEKVYKGFETGVAPM